MQDELLWQVIKSLTPTVFNKLSALIIDRAMKREDLLFLVLCIIAENNIQLCTSLNVLTETINKLNEQITLIDRSLTHLSDKVELLIHHD